MMEQLREREGRVGGAVVLAREAEAPRPSGAPLFCAREKRLMLFPPRSSHEVALANVDASHVMCVIVVAAARVVVCCRRRWLGICCGVAVQLVSASVSSPLFLMPEVLACS
jgi:hypothetical protein